MLEGKRQRKSREGLYSGEFNSFVLGMARGSLQVHNTVGICATQKQMDEVNEKRSFFGRSWTHGMSGT